MKWGLKGENTTDTEQVLRGLGQCVFSQLVMQVCKSTVADLSISHF